MQLISSEAAEISTEEKKATIGPEHIIRALQRLGFDSYVPEVSAQWQQLKDDSKGKTVVPLVPSQFTHLPLQFIS